MAHYAITYVYAAPEEQAKYRPAHREYLACSRLLCPRSSSFPFPVCSGSYVL